MGSVPRRRPTRAWHLATVVVSLVWIAVGVASPDGRGATPARPSAAPLPVAQALGDAQPASGPRLSAVQLKALVFLCHTGPTTKGAFDLGVGEDVFGPVAEQQLTAAEQPLFDEQWAAAVAASRKLMTPQQAAAAGYVQAAPFNVGVGAHWIKWSLVGGPFDPARPSMLLFDGLPGRQVKLVGFAYWVQSPTAPQGYAGPNDRWHRHAGLCFSKDGWLAEQGVKDAKACGGYWLNGRNLWMLHAWVVPDFPNRWGRFAPTNPNLCPPPTKELVSCQTAS